MYRLITTCIAAVITVSLGMVVGRAISPPTATAQPVLEALPTQPAAPAPTVSAAPAPRTGRTSVTSPTSVPDAFDTIQRALDYLRANYSPQPSPSPSPSPTPSPSPSPTPSPTPPPPPVVGRFPGDPGVGKIVIGAIVSGAGGTADAWEKANGAKLGAHRTYFRAGVSDLAPNGPVLAYIKAEQAAGRVAQVSIKLGPWGPIAAGQYDAQLKAFRDAVEATSKPVDVIIHHEPQNDLGSYGTAAQFVAAQEHIRSVFGPTSSLKRLSFGGSLMTYGWTSQGIAKFGPVDAWFPKPGTWDWVGGDQYAQAAGAPIDDPKLSGFIASAKQHGVLPAITELGIRSADPDAAAKLKALFDKLITDGFVKMDWYDSDNNSTGAGWVMTGPLLQQFVALCQDPRAARPAA